MHKKEASLLFKVLSDEDRVKILKFLYNSEELSINDLLFIIGCNLETLKEHLSILENSHLIVVNEDNNYICNKDLVDQLMSFITTPCGCMSKK